MRRRRETQINYSDRLGWLDANRSSWTNLNFINPAVSIDSIINTLKGLGFLAGSVDNDLLAPGLRKEMNDLLAG